MAGRVYEYVDKADAKAIRNAVARVGRPRLFEVMGVGTGAHWHGVLSGRKPMTRAAAERLRTSLHKAGADVEPSRALVVSKTKAITITRAKPGPKPKASLDVLGPLRLDARHVLEAKFGGRVPDMARALQITAGDLGRLVEGSYRPSLDEASMLSKRIHDLTGSALAESWDPGFPQGPALDPPHVRARALLAKFAPEAVSIVLQLAAQGGAS